MQISKLLFPDKCLFCGKMLRKTEEIYCDSCENNGVLRTSVVQCDLSILPNVLNLYCPLQYTGAGKDSVIRYKFNGENWLAEPFAQLLHETIVKADGYRHCAWISAVPISRKRYKTRGYNQSALIAEKLSKLSGIPYREFLVRKDTGATDQTGKMNRTERYQSNRFVCKKAEHISGGILLVDDILTTGSTINECASLLLDAGADFVKAAILASGRRDLGGICA